MIEKEAIKMPYYQNRKTKEVFQVGAHIVAKHDDWDKTNREIDAKEAEAILAVEVNKKTLGQSESGNNPVTPERGVNKSASTAAADNNKSGGTK